jgi:hypothetical protein
MNFISSLSLALVVQFSLPYNSTAKTRVEYNYILIFFLSFLGVKMLLIISVIFRNVYILLRISFFYFHMILKFLGSYVCSLPLYYCYRLKKNYMNRKKYINNFVLYFFPYLLNKCNSDMLLYTVLPNILPSNYPHIDIFTH